VRLLHSIRSEEIPVCQGQYLCLIGGRRINQIELWRITRLPDGTEIVRADISREGGPDLLTHLQRGPSGRPEWLRVRYKHGSINAAAQYTFEDEVVRVARQLEGQPVRQEMMDIATGYEVDYPPVIGHDYVWRGYPDQAQGRVWAMPVFSPDLWGEEIMGGRVLRFSVKPRGAERCETPAGLFEQASHFEVVLSDGVRAFSWFDERGIPLRWLYPDKGYDFVLAAYTKHSEISYT